MFVSGWCRRGWRLLFLQIVLAGTVWNISGAWINAQTPATDPGGISLASPPSHDKPALDIPNIHKQPFFWTVMVASVLGWVLGMVKGFDSSKDWLAKYWTKVPKPLLFGTDLLIFVIVGAYIGTGLYQPSSFSGALAAGLSWPVALGALASKAAPPAGPGVPENKSPEVPPKPLGALPPAGAHRQATGD